MSYEAAVFTLDVAAGVWNGLLAGLLFALHRTYRRPYLRDWGRSWLALSLAGIASALPFAPGSTLSAAHPARLLAVAVWLAACYWQAIYLIAGAHALTSFREAPKGVVRRLVAMAAVVAVLIAAVSAGFSPPLRFAVRTAGSYIVVTVAFVLAGSFVLRGQRARTSLGRRMVGLGFILQGLDRAAGVAAVALTWGRPFVGDALAPIFYLALVDFGVFAFLALGMVVWLLEEQREEARRAGALAALGTLVAGVAHEARNPLFGLSAALDAFEARRASPEHRAFLLAMRASLERLSRLMEQLLDLGRPARQERESVVLAELLEEAIAATQSQAAAAGVRVAIARDGATRPLALERERMIQVFRNLIENAVQHSVRDSQIEMRVQHPEPGFVEVAVSDTGPGFSADDLPHVFDPFFSRRRGGTGLGLAIVRRIVEEHGGSVFAENGEAGGARVVVRLRAH